ncbi:MAG TPA: Ig-like domain-containing protein [Gemmatimonadaceae bacterium]|jgi:hypothetical protein
MRSFRRVTPRVAQVVAAVASIVLLATCDLDKITSTSKPLDQNAVSKLFSIVPDSLVTLAGTVNLKVGAGSKVDATHKVLWSSSNTNVVTVDSSTGLMTGLAIGAASIIARYIAPELDSEYTQSLAVRVRYKAIKVAAVDSIAGMGSAGARAIAVNGTNNNNVVQQPAITTSAALTAHDSGATTTNIATIAGQTVVGHRNGKFYVVATFDAFKDSVLAKVRQVAKTILFPTTDFTATAIKSSGTCTSPGAGCLLVPVTVKDVADTLIAAPNMSFRVADTLVAVITPSTGTLQVKKNDTTRIFVTVDTVTRSQKLIVSQVPASLTKSAGDAQTDTVAHLVKVAPMVTVLDAGSTAIAGATVTFRVGGGGGAAIVDSVKTTDANGQATLGSWKLGNIAGANSVIATAGSATATFTATGVPGPARKLAYSVQPHSAAINTAIAPAVKLSVLDSLSNVVTTATDSVFIEFGSDPTNSAGLNGTTRVAAVAGVASFSDLSVTTTGIGFTLLSTSDTLSGAFSQGFDVFGAATKVGFITQPTGTSAGATMPTFRVAVQDASGATVTTATDSVFISSSGGSLGGTGSRTAAVGGIATFSNLNLSPAGTYQLNAQANGLTTATSASFNISAVGAPAKLAFSAQPTNAAAGASLGTVKVQVLDANGALVTSSAPAITLSIFSNPGGGTIGGGVTQAAAGGEATFTNVFINKAGAGYRLSASAGGSIASATSVAFDVTAGTAVKIGFVQQPTHTPTGTTMAPVTVAVQDANNNTVTSQAPTSVTLALTGCSATLSGTTQATTSSGVATFNALTLATVATGCGLTATATGLSTGSSSPFSVVAATGPVKLAFTTQPAASTAGVGGSGGTVAIQDANGNAVATPNAVSITISVLSGPASINSGTATISTTSSANFPSITFTTSGTYKLLASAPGFRTDSSTAFVVAAAAPAKLGIITQPSNIVAGVPFSSAVRVAVQDQFGNTVTAATHTVQLAASAASVGALTFNNGTATSARAAVGGVATFNDMSIRTAATSATLVASTPAGTLTASPSSSAFDVTAAPASALVFTAGPASGTFVGTTLGTAQVQAQDSVGNVRLDFGAPVSVGLFGGPSGTTLFGTKTAVPSSGVATFNTLSTNSVGTYRLAASASGMSNGGSSPFTVTANESVLAATPFDPWDLTLTGSTLVWSETGVIRKMDAAGGTVTDIATLTAGVEPFAVATDGNEVFFISNDGTLKKVGIGGGAVTTLVTGMSTTPHPHLELEGPLTTGTVYFADGTSLRKIAKNAASTVFGSTTVVATIRGRTTNSRTFALSGGNLFYSTTGGIVKVPTAGGATTTLNSDLANSLFVSGTTLFYLTPGSELKSASTAGAATPASLNFFQSHGKLTSDGTFLYLATDFGVVKISIATPTNWVRFSTNDIWGVALDGTNVYWAKFVEATNSTEIYKAPK